MQIFEYPYVIITLLVLSFIILGIIGAYFALQTFKAAKETGAKEFTNIKKLENMFEKLGSFRENRCLIYISISLENARSLYSDSVAWDIYSEIKPILLRTFAGEEKGDIAIYDQKNFIALNNWSMQQAKRMVEQCLAQINQCLLKFKAIKVVDIKFGSYFVFSNQITFDEAISRAKQACTLAETENEVYVEWNNKSGKALEKRINIENNIENEIDNNHFFLEYQPVIDAKTKKLVGAEVLSRLNSENEGILTPKNFLSAVNSVGLSDKFDFYIFEKNCKWIANKKSQREAYVYTINFSRSTLCDPLFAKNIKDVIEKYNLKYSTLAIEVLEDMNVTGTARDYMINNLKELKEKGISILLDDFGSGYTTFGDLQSLAIDTVKIDKSITNKAETEAGFTILKNIVRTAKDLGMKSVCEGIETKEHERLAIEAGCDMLQGYYYYRPMSVVQLEALFENNKDSDVLGGV